MSSRKIYRIIVLFTIGINMAQVRCQKSTSYDPVTMDPVLIDIANPAKMIEQPPEFISHGSRLNGIIYLAQGKGPHRTILLLHGLPGNERNLDLAHALRRVGWNVMFFHYRGSWGSEGEFLPTHCVEDVHSILQILHNPTVQSKYRIDGDKVVVIGHSMGGAMAVIAGAQSSFVKGVVTIAPANMVAVLQTAPPEQRSGFNESIHQDLALNPPKEPTFTADISSNKKLFNLPNHADSLATKPCLVIHGLRDEAVPIHCHAEPLIQALKEAKAPDCIYAVFDADHGFSDKRITLTRTIVDWLEERF